MKLLPGKMRVKLKMDLYFFQPVCQEGDVDMCCNWCLLVDCLLKWESTSLQERTEKGEKN